MTNNNIRIMIVDDHLALRESLAFFIDKESDMSVIAQASNGNEAIEKSREHLPDVVLMDITMPTRGGIEAIEIIHREHPAIVLLVLTMHEEQQLLRSVLLAGGSGYVTKRAASEELLQAIRQVANGNAYINIALNTDGLKSVLAEPTNNPNTSLEKLSQREREVLRMVALGYTNKEIADQMNISKGSVDSYRSRISQKLQTKNRVDLVKIAKEMALLDAKD